MLGKKHTYPVRLGHKSMNPVKIGHKRRHKGVRHAFMSNDFPSSVPVPTADRLKKEDNGSGKLGE